ncbi:biotin--[acetyl-CoA-carboxylase] ligase [Thiomicrorhabdus sp. zzn3]|uniref:biotin--[acetyl-CoA-carboxylase] ligase n=1 Tax=Thiomicrorhabdus sp. zzn3 TaxID=3039775 RepID=UPI0024363880|nr:biotin--[acetyl-CoA-carboxylase] ligase [Thiomicrorhabdus sp. zzn3]MDG6777080.1 biotin--[acetyl-CoA-carboxylase] ligase [Thiomicrorhabdus sp. zzn3]
MSAVSKLMHQCSLLEKQFVSLLPDFRVICLDEADSTNRVLMREFREAPAPAFCIANTQTDGYGQRGREWISNSDSLTFSLLLHCPLPLHRIDGLTQIIALCLINSLKVFSDQCFTVKWPNDVYFDGSKVAGILVESLQYSDEDAWLIIGVGLNVMSADQDKKTFLSDDFEAEFVQFTDFTMINEFLVLFASHVNNLLRQFTDNTFANYLSEYASMDYFSLGEKVIVYDNGQPLHAIYQGVNKVGELMVDIDGSLKYYRNGSVSIRPLV